MMFHILPLRWSTLGTSLDLYILLGISTSNLRKIICFNTVLKYFKVVATIGEVIISIPSTLKQLPYYT